MASRPDGCTKVRISLTPAVGSADSELVWAEWLEPDIYQVWNVPFFAYNVNIADVVRCSADHDALVTERGGVVERGQRTFWAVGFRSLIALERFAAGIAEAQAQGVLRLDDGYQPDLPLFEPDARAAA